MGGNELTAEENNGWNPVVYKFADNFEETMLSSRSKLIMYAKDFCSSSSWGDTDIDWAPYISHLGFMNDATTGN